MSRVVAGERPSHNLVPCSRSPRRLEGRQIVRAGWNHERPNQDCSNLKHSVAESGTRLAYGNCFLVPCCLNGRSTSLNVNHVKFRQPRSVRTARCVAERVVRWCKCEHVQQGFWRVLSGRRAPFFVAHDRSMHAFGQASEFSVTLSGGDASPPTTQLESIVGNQCSAGLTKATGISGPPQHGQLGRCGMTNGFAATTFALRGALYDMAAGGRYDCFRPANRSI